MVSILLAPMAGFTNAVTRRMAHNLGAAWCYTEMVNAAGLARADGRSWQLLELLPGEGAVVAHLYGSEPDDFARAAERVAATGRFSAIDINAGCPVPRICHTGAGAGLMRTPGRVGAIIRAVRDAAGLPVTVKTRLGLKPGAACCHEMLAHATEAGAAAFTIHGRYLTQGHSGEVDFAEVERLAAAATIPLIGNGGIRDYRTASEWVARTGVKRLMVGQAAIGNPWLFRELQSACESEGAVIPPRPALDEIRTAIGEHLAGEMEHRRLIAGRYRLPPDIRSPEEAAVITFRIHLFRYLRGLRGATRLRRRLTSLATLTEVAEVVDACLAQEAEFRALA